MPAVAWVVLLPAAAYFAWMGVLLRRMGSWPESLRRGKAAPELNTIRNEMRVVGPREAALRGDLLDPDPLEKFASAFEQLRDDCGDHARVAVDLVSLGRRGRRRFLKQTRGGANSALRTSARRGTGAATLDELQAAAGLPGGSTSSDRVAQSRETKYLRDREADVHLFELQILIEVSSEIPGRPQLLMQGFLASFDQFAGDAAHLRVRGLPLFGRFYFGADWLPRRWWFDYRMRTGHCRAPGIRNVVAAREVYGLLKPPTKRCNSNAIIRSAGDVAPVPRNIPVYERRPGVLPFGLAAGQMVGMRMDEFFFGYLSGKSRFGKTELALVQLLHVALVERAGAFFLDPHDDAVIRLKPYLANPLTMNRVIELNLSHNDLDRRHVAWNPLSMEGRSLSDIANRAQAVVDAASVVQKWGASASRIPIITGQAAVSMLHLGLLLPPELSPTLFTMVTFLSDEEWRKKAITKLPGYLQHYWNKVYPGPDAAAPLINMIMRIGRSDVARATLGSPQSTYDARQAMDDGVIVLACPGGGREASMASFIVFDLLHAAKSRADIPADQRKMFYAYFDELQAYDDGDVVPDFMEQCAKYGARVVALNQSPQRLTARTLDAISTNSSFLTTTATSAEGAKYFDRQWADSGAKGMVPRLPRFNYLSSVMLDGAATPPFRLAGLPIERVWNHDDGGLKIPNVDALPELEAAIDARYRPRTVRESLKLTTDHDQKVLEALMGGRTVRPVVEEDIAPGEIASWLEGLNDVVDEWERTGQAPPDTWGKSDRDDDDDDTFDVRFGE